MKNDKVFIIRPFKYKFIINEEEQESCNTK